MVHDGLRHEPVLSEEVIHLLDPQPGRDYLDLTLGGGGHARRILLHAPGCRVLGVDRDRETLENTTRALAAFADRFRGLWSRFDRADEEAGGPAARQFAGILLDLGMSSLQVDDASRGFSMKSDGPLDLRMDRSGGETAADVLARWGEAEIAEALARYGDERHARAIARAIVERRRFAPIRRTQELAELVARVVGRPGHARIDPATRTFQALRVVVNDELGCLERVLPRCLDWLEIGGRLAVISFHSGEDRIVKRFFRAESRRGRVTLLTRKAVRPGAEEVRRNRRARSARLRAARLLPGDPVGHRQE